MVLPQQIITLIEQDAKQILWATTPTLDGKEDGSDKCRRWIKERASYLPAKKGGAGIMHWSSHCEAYYATWIVKYLHPRKAPWKILLRHYIDDEYIHEGILLSAATDRDRTQKVPASATYMRKCLRAFAALGITQDTSLLDCSIQAEPLWHNNRWFIPIPDAHAMLWQKYIDVTHVLSLLNTRS